MSARVCEWARVLWSITLHIRQPLESLTPQAYAGGADAGGGNAVVNIEDGGAHRSSGGGGGGGGSGGGARRAKRMRSGGARAGGAADDLLLGSAEDGFDLAQVGARATPNTHTCTRSP